MPPQELLQLIRDAAATWGLEWSLVAAVVDQESGGDAWLSRYEPKFFAKYLDNDAIRTQVAQFCTKASYTVSRDTELRERAFSRGLMQVMGQTARELAFPYPLAALHDPEHGLAVGCKKLKRCLTLAKGDLPKTLLMYNGGGNPAYPGEVLARKEKYEHALA